jgi:scyllo-inositol 2-dehydrogenase (NADP+)
VRGFGNLDEALADPDTGLVVIATPHDSHPELVVRTLEAGKPCVVDKVMALTSRDADRMIAARDRAGVMLSVFHNRRWDWDFLTVRDVLAKRMIGTPRIIESSVCRSSPPRSWRGHQAAAGSILHDWGAHLVDQALQLGFGPCRRLSAWLMPGPWEGIDSGGHGQITLHFDEVVMQVETSRMCRLERPRWWVVGTQGGFMKYGIDPQETALRNGNLDLADEAAGEIGRVWRENEAHESVEGSRLPSVRGSWDRYYENVAAHLRGAADLAVTAEEGREVVRVLEAAMTAAVELRTVEGPWGFDTSSR